MSQDNQNDGQIEVISDIESDIDYASDLPSDDEKRNFEYEVTELPHYPLDHPFFVNKMYIDPKTAGKIWNDCKKGWNNFSEKKPKRKSALIGFIFFLGFLFAGGDGIINNIVNKIPSSEIVVEQICCCDQIKCDSPSEKINPACQEGVSISEKSKNEIKETIQTSSNELRTIFEAELENSVNSLSTDIDEVKSKCTINDKNE